MTDHPLSEQDWAIRLYVYQFFVEQTCPPNVEEVAAHFAISPDDACAAFHRLNAGHAIFLQPGADTILMAHPLSTVPTPYRVQIENRWLYANCAWDSLGIPAMLNTDARIETEEAYTGKTIFYQIVDGELRYSEELLVHFTLPFAQWYDNLIHT